MVGNVAHEKQCPLGERNVDEGGAGAEREAETDLLAEEERREGPEFVQGKDEGEDTAELVAEFRDIENGSGGEVEADSESDECGDDEHDHGPGWRSESLLERFLHPHEAC